MNVMADYADDFDVAGRFVASVAAIEAIGGSVLMAAFPRWSLLASLVWLAVLLGSIVALCVVDMPRRLRTMLIAALTVVFVLTGARLDLLGTVGSDVALHQAGLDVAPPIVTRARSETADAPAAAPVAVVHADTQDGWTADIDALLSGLSRAEGVRAIIRSVTVDRSVEPNRVAIDWSIAAGDARKSCGSITIAAADRQVALDQVGATLRMAVDRTRATATPQCY